MSTEKNYCTPFVQPSPEYHLCWGAETILICYRSGSSVKNLNDLLHVFENILQNAGPENDHIGEVGNQHLWLCRIIPWWILIIDYYEKLCWIQIHELCMLHLMHWAWLVELRDLSACGISLECVWESLHVIFKTYFLEKMTLHFERCWRGGYQKAYR